MAPTQAPRDEAEPVHLDCIHCGLCLPVCPTYLQLGIEADAPRGRIYLINAMKEGRVPAGSPAFQRHMDLCLECRACETACPSGVRFTTMMNEARVEITRRRKASAGSRLLRRLLLEGALTSPRILHLGFRALRLYQRCGLQALVRASGTTKILPGTAARMEALLPDVPAYFSFAPRNGGTAAGEETAALFWGCVMPELFGPVHGATVRVLNRNGVSVTLPRRQACCGAIHLHQGDLETARRLARRNIEAFESGGDAPVVVNAAGCGTMLKEYGELLAEDRAFAPRAAAFSRRVRDISEYLDALGIDRNLRRLDLTVTYDDPCHLLHGQKIRAAPRNLLGAIPGVRLVELRDADRCCGSAGIYNLTQPEMSGRILEEKIANIVRTGAQVVATGNPGCHLQILAGLRERRLSIRVVHPVELLDQAYQAAGAG